jgi:hypothetical protein
MIPSCWSSNVKLPPYNCSLPEFVTVGWFAILKLNYPLELTKLTHTGLAFATSLAISFWLKSHQLLSFIFTTFFLS